MRDMFWEPERIVYAYRQLPERIPKRLWAVLQDAFSVPKLAPFLYFHVSALGAETDFPLHGEPKPRPIINSPADLDKLREPDDYLTAGIMPERLKVAEEVARLWGGVTAMDCIGGDFAPEGPITTAMLLAGQQFLLWPYDHPEAAHRLLDFCARSAANYRRQINISRGGSGVSPSGGIKDDFAGILPPKQFEEFVLPYWEQLYTAMGAQRRSLHSELIRPEHLPLLARVKLAVFDPGADQYLTPEQLKAACPCAFRLRFLSWHLRDNTAEQLQAMYRRYATFEPYLIQFGIEMLSHEEKFLALLEVARELNGET